MQVSEKLATEIFTILSFHIVAIVALFSTSFYIYLRGRRTLLLKSYISVVSMLLLWMISKILKTVSPNETLRWFFIVTQYLGVQFLGYCLVIFAYLYTVKPSISRKQMIILAVVPTLCFLVIVTNPLHMQFYSYFDFYKDSFGPLFLPTQLFAYGYISASIVLLAKGYTKQPGFKGKKGLARLTAVTILVPLLGNVYYILFKLIKPIPWIFPFAVFDFTPIAGAASLMLFMIPALKYRFFDISPISFKKLFENVPQGIVFVHPSGHLYAKNRTFTHMFQNAENISTAAGFVDTLGIEDADKKRFWSFMGTSSAAGFFELHLPGDKCYRVKKNHASKNSLLLRFTDISKLMHNKKLLEKKNKQLVDINIKLDGLARASKELTAAKIKMQVSQNMHDILGHSLTVVIGSAELAMRDSEYELMRVKLNQIDELLSNSLQDLKNTLQGKETDWNQSALTRAISALKNDSIHIDFSSQGHVYELTRDKTEAVYSLCREAVTNAIRHGAAEMIHLILRYKPAELEVYAIDDGHGCGKIEKHLGLSGIELRVGDVGGHVIFASNGEKGFTIHAFIPKD